MLATISDYFPSLQDLIVFVLLMLFYAVAALVPVCCFLYGIYLLLTRPMRRNERVRLFVDILELGLKDGRSPEAAIVDAAPRARQLALLNAHPDLAGRLAVSGELTAESTSEQASAGLDKCSPDEFRRFTELNEAYKRKFPFPFIMAVKGKSRAEILKAFEHRIHNAEDIEFRTALSEVHKIALIRLRDL